MDFWYIYLAVESKLMFILIGIETFGVNSITEDPDMWILPLLNEVEERRQYLLPNKSPDLNLYPSTGKSIVIHK